MDKKGRISEREAMVELPEEIVEDILLRLSVKSLSRFKTTCKSWYSIITSTEFVKEHLNHARAARHNKHKNFLGLLIPRKDASYPCVLYKEDFNGIIHAKEFDFPYKVSVDHEYKVSLEVLNSCDGLICSAISRDHTILVWNPSLPTEYMIIETKWIENVDAIGMGYDPISDDYKIIKVPSLRTVDEDYVSVEIFSLKSSSWRSKRIISKLNSVEYDGSRMIYANNRLHWIAMDHNEQEDDDENWVDYIVYFDLTKESLDYMNPPSKSLLCSNVINYKDTIAIVGEAEISEFQQELWILQEYCGIKSSWNKLFCFYSDIPNFSFGMNGKMIVVAENGRLRKYDAKDGHLDDVVVQGDNITFEECFYFNFTSSCVESLVSPIRHGNSSPLAYIAT